MDKHISGMNAAAITAIGLFVAGHSQADALFSTLAAGQSVIRDDIRMLNYGIAHVPSGALIPGQVEWLDKTYSEISGKATSVAGKMLFHSAIQAMRNAGLEPSDLPKNNGMFIGINKNVISIEQIYSLFRKQGGQHQTLNLLRPDQVVEPLIDQWKFGGHVQVHGDACAAGANAIISGYRSIVSGHLDLALCGATEQASQPIMQLFFYRIGALCQKSFAKAEHASRAFDKNRNGCVLSDGSAVLILENVDKALARGARILAYVVGAFRQSEAYQITSSSPDGRLYARCMRMAIQDAGLCPQDIDHINAHGTSTVINDAAEAQAIYDVFKTKPSVTSTKSALGHSLATSGAIELALSALTIHKQRLLPSINFNQPRQGEPFLNMVKQSRSEPLKYVQSNSFGFGGENCSIVLAREVS